MVRQRNCTSWFGNGVVLQQSLKAFHQQFWGSRRVAKDMAHASLLCLGCCCDYVVLPAEQQAQQSQALKMFTALLGQQGSGQTQGAASTGAADQGAAAGGTNSLEVGAAACGSCSTFCSPFDTGGSPDRLPVAGLACVVNDI